MSIFWIFFVLSWAAYAAFVGLTGLLLVRFRGLRVVPYVAASGLIVVATAAMVVDQQVFFYPIIRNCIYGLSVAAMILLMAAWLTARSFASRLGRYARAISGAAFLAAAVHSVIGPGGFFMPLLFFPEADVYLAHAIFAGLFLGVVAAIFLALKRLPQEEAATESSPKTPSVVWRVVTNGRFWLRLSAALVALFWLVQWAVPRHYGGLVNVWGEPGMSPAMLGDTEMLCTGHFSKHWQPFRWCWGVILSPCLP